MCLSDPPEAKLTPSILEQLVEDLVQIRDVAHVKQQGVALQGRLGKVEHEVEMMACRLARVETALASLSRTLTSLRNVRVPQSRPYTEIPPMPRERKRRS